MKGGGLMGKAATLIANVVRSLLAIFGMIAGFVYIERVMVDAEGGIGLFARITLIMITVVMGIVLNVFLHELGHLITGLLSGYSFAAFSIFSQHIIKKDGKLIRKKARLKGASGVCTMSPPEMVNGKYPYKLFFFGGILMNFITAAICLALFLLLASSTELWASVSLVFGVIAAWLGLGSLIPAKYSKPDGYFLLYLSGEDKKEERVRLWTVAQIKALQVAGCRPRDIPYAYFECVNVNDSIDNILALFIAERRYHYWLDKREMEKASAIAQSIYDNIDSSLKGHKIVFAPSLLFHELIDKCRENEVSRLFTRDAYNYMERSLSDMAAQRTLYAYARLVSKNDAKIRMRLNSFNKACLDPEIFEVGNIPGERELIVLVDEMANER